MSLWFWIVISMEQLRQKDAELEATYTMLDRAENGRLQEQLAKVTDERDIANETVNFVQHAREQVLVDLAAANQRAERMEKAMALYQKAVYRHRKTCRVCERTKEVGHSKPCIVGMAEAALASLPAPPASHACALDDA